MLFYESLLEQGSIDVMVMELRGLHGLMDRGASVMQKKKKSQAQTKYLCLKPTVIYHSHTGGLNGSA